MQAAISAILLRILSLNVKTLTLIGIATILISMTPSREKLRALYGSLDKRSVAQHLALYQLYPNSPEGQRALSDALNLLTPKGTQLYMTAPIQLPLKGVEAVVALVNKQPLDDLPDLTPNELTLIRNLASHLPNRRLKGNRAKSESEVLELAPDQIDLARALLLSQLGASSKALHQLETYEAMLDLMALQLLARLTDTATPQQKIRELNRFVFETMNFRFPPKSLHKQDIHLYTFLPSVLDTRRGVCLGVSILYACLAQRLGLNLELITPPGHIFVRYRDAQGEINIETTLRGVHIDSEEYLAVDTRELQQRNMKETVGLAHVNEASVWFQQGNYAQALISYQKAHPYLRDDPLLKELMGYSYLMLGDESKSRELLEPLQDYISPYSIGRNTLLDDVLTKRASGKALSLIFQSDAESAIDLQTKREQIKAILRDYPNFRTGWLQLGSTLLALERTGEALESFERYHQLDDQNATTEYALAALYAQRMHYPKAWEHLRQAEHILASYQHDPDCVRQIRKQLTLRCPEP